MFFASHKFSQSGCFDITEKRETHWYASHAKYSEIQHVCK